MLQAEGSDLGLTLFFLSMFTEHIIINTCQVLRILRLRSSWIEQFIYSENLPLFNMLLVEFISLHMMIVVQKFI